MHLFTHTRSSQSGCLPHPIRPRNTKIGSAKAVRLAIRGVINKLLGCDNFVTWLAMNRD
jgi:hypothetical protein